MPVAPTYPGVYVQEVPSGVRTISGVSTSVTLFVGRTEKGPLFSPTRCLSYTDFARTFGESPATGDMARYAKLYYLNGGTDAYFLRVAEGATSASVTLQSEEGAEVLTLTAKQPGAVGETIRAAVSYGGANPESTFHLQLFRWQPDASGRLVAVEGEEWKNLSMNPGSPLYAPAFLTQESKLVNAEAAGGVPAPSDGISQSGRPVPYTSGDGGELAAAWGALVGDEEGATANRFRISVDGGSFVEVDLGEIDVSSLDAATPESFATGFAGAVSAAVDAALAADGQNGVGVTVELETDGPNAVAGTDSTSLLRFTSENAGDVRIRPAGSRDAAVPLMLGAEQGGLEVGAHAAARPAPTGISLRLDDPDRWEDFAEMDQGDLNVLQLGGASIPLNLASTGANEPLYRDGALSSPSGNNDGVREKLGRIRDAVNAYRQSNSASFFWRAELAGQRLTLVPTAGGDSSIGALVVDGPGDDLATMIPGVVGANVRYYTVGAGGEGGRQTPAVQPASDGTAPTLAAYEHAFEIAEREIDLFNLLVLPADREPAVDMRDVWGPASVFCKERRAFLLMDAPASWADAQTASTEVANLRTGLVKDHAALYFPRLTVNDAGLKVNVGATGAVAGIMARTDAARGVWKAPAGTDADVRGAVGLATRLSDREQGLLNPQGVNALRVFPQGILNWGARTMDGADDFASEWKHVPVRRLALFMEESLYRGLKWAVFEPNDEPLWAEIRLNAGSFMHRLFRQGAFQGSTPQEAYFVKCDAETTPQADRNLGIVNIWVGFAPLKPAEFVILSLQQMAGQIEV